MLVPGETPWLWATAVAVTTGTGVAVGLPPTTPAETNAVSRAAVPAMMPPTAVNTPGRVDQNDFAPEGFDSGCDSGIGSPPHPS